MKLFSQVFRKVFKTFTKIDSRFLYVSAEQKDYSSVNDGAILDCLRKFSIPFTEGYTCFCAKKCMCGKGLSCEVFINKKTGLSMCEQCGVAVDWDVYCDLLTKSENQTFDAEYFKEKSYNFNLTEWDDVVNKTQSLEYFPDKTCFGILGSFNLKPFSRSIIEKLRVRISAEKDILYFPLYISDSVVGYKTFHKNGEENVFPKVNCPGVLKSLNDTNKTSAIVVATIPDFLALLSVKLHSYSVICLPYGVLHLPQSSLPFFERYNKILLWLGGNCLDLTAAVAEKFNRKRCYVVQAHWDQLSASDAVKKNLHIPKLISEAKLCYHEFITTFSSFRSAIVNELQNPEKSNGIPLRGFPKLSKIIKGHRRGELTLLTGPTGVGKTTFLSQYSLDLASQGVFTLWGSFEIKTVRLAKTMLTQFAKAPLPSSIPELDAVCNKFEELPIFFLTFHGQQPLVNVMDAIKHSSYIYDIAHVIIDNVQFMIEVCPDSKSMDRFYQQDYMIQIFRSFATHNNCHVTLVMHPKKTDNCDLGINSIFGGAKATQEADNIFIIQRCQTSGYDKYLEVAKNRFSGDLGSIPLYFHKPSLNFSEGKIISENFKRTAEEFQEEDYDCYERNSIR